MKKALSTNVKKMLKKLEKTRLRCYVAAGLPVGWLLAGWLAKLAVQATG